MYIPVHFLASSFSDEKLDIVWNHWLPVSTAMFCAHTKLAINAPKDGRGIGQKQVLEQNLSSTDVHGRTSVERYTDVQQLKMVQMVSQSQFFRGFYLLYLMRLPACPKKCAKFYSCEGLIPFITTQSVRQNYTSVYSFDCKLWLCHNIAAAWNNRHPWR